jgi:hypothetical protein
VLTKTRIPPATVDDVENPGKKGYGRGNGLQEVSDGLALCSRERQTDLVVMTTAGLSAQGPREKNVGGRGNSVM